MKYHLVGEDGKTSLCKKAKRNPRQWVFDKEGFESHHAKDMECKLCRKFINKKG